MDERPNRKQHRDIFEQHDPFTDLMRSWGWIDSKPQIFPVWACVVQHENDKVWGLEDEGAINGRWGLPLLFRDEAGALRACLYFYCLYASLNNVPTKRWNAMVVVDELEFEIITNKKNVSPNNS